MRQNFNIFTKICQGIYELTLEKSTVMLFCLFESKWQGRLDSNQRMPRSKPGALPLGDAPN